MTRTLDTGIIQEPAYRRARLFLAYDGSQFHGFADNPGVRTVAGELAAALGRIVRQPVTVTGAGRTDAGVHAWGQVVSVDLPVSLELDGLARRLTKMCAPGIVVRCVEWTTPDFDARHSAVWRKYRYLVLNDPVGDPLLEHVAWWVPTRLDLALMRLACDPVIGEHDFSSFCRRPPDLVAPSGESTPARLTRRVLDAHWSEEQSPKGQRLLWFHVQANAFCHQMVRALVGTFVDVGLGKIAPGTMRGILAARDRQRAGQVAPPQGLTLWEVGYRDIASPETGVGPEDFGVS